MYATDTLILQPLDYLSNPHARRNIKYEKNKNTGWDFGYGKSPQGQVSSKIKYEGNQISFQCLKTSQVAYTANMSNEYFANRWVMSKFWHCARATVQRAVFTVAGPSVEASAAFTYGSAAVRVDPYTGYPYPSIYGSTGPTGQRGYGDTINARKARFRRGGCKSGGFQLRIETPHRLRERGLNAISRLDQGVDRILGAGCMLDGTRVQCRICRVDRWVFTYDDHGPNKGLPKCGTLFASHPEALAGHWQQKPVCVM
ncbi:hypothetical protein B0H17DRAFT_1137476 [Mycena rosella]|uniref:Uncharacterized protein n=1 Tax=Mycena rosella TaxID=1033263 RepID=A0AAD7D8A5_MYCRO|nr:hypothetical protein B0H17DRAFT_1137476 [Mycena rosella]